MHQAFLRTARASIASSGLAGLALLSASCGGGGDSTAPPPQVGSLSISPAGPAQVSAGGTLQVSVTVKDTKGLVMSGQSVTYTTSAPSIATVSNQGVVSAPGPVGAADITASSGGVSASLSVTVVAGASASLTRTSADPANVSAGAAVGDSVRFVVKDAFANPRAGDVVTFAVAAGNGQVSPAVAQTDAQGRVATRFRTGTTAGPNTLTATVNGVAPVSLALTTVASSVSITSVTPSPIVPGATVTINGSGFSATSTEDVVTVDGQTATITTASSTQITFVAPASPCAPSHQANLELIVNGASGFARPTLRTGTLRTIPVGSAVLIRDPADLRCTELSPAGAQYTVSVLNTSQSLSPVTPFRFTGTTTIPASASIAVNPFVLHQSVNVIAPRRPATTMETGARDRALAHRRVMEANREIYRRFKNRVRSRRGAAASVSPSVRASLSVPSTVSAAVAVGDTRLFRVVRIAAASVSCSSFDEITARAVHVGTKSIIWEDIAAPLHGQMDAHLVRLGDEFDATMYVSDSTYFGDPLVTDVDTDNDQHLNMVFTPIVPTGIAGFVILCDFFPRNTTDNQGSNLGETFYAAVPTVAGSGFTGNTADNWIRRMRSIIVHEVKHIASDGAHLEQNAFDLEESWLEEGMAMTAEEVWGRNSVYHTTWKGNADYRSTLYCDVRSPAAGCPNLLYDMFDHFVWLYDFMNLIGGRSLFGSVVDADPSFYGTAWSFIRWNADRASSEVNFLRGITQAFDVVGLANIARQAAADPEQMLAMWSLSLYLDEQPAFGGNPDIRFPSWNTRDVFSGMSTDFPNSFPKAFPLSAQQIGGSGNFSVDHDGIYGGSFFLYDLLAAAAETRVISLIPGTLPIPGLRLVVARVQ